MGRPRLEQTKTCPRCGVVFTPKRADRTYCGRKCAQTRDLPTKSCASCGETFRKNPTYSYEVWEKIQFCSIRCRGNGKPKTARTCEHCGTTFENKRGKRSVNHFCSSACFGAWRSATASLDQTANGSFSAAAKRALMERAGGACQTCGATEDLEFDHVISRAAGGQGTLENGQVLCSACHWQKTLSERQLMQRLLRAHYGLEAIPDPG